MNGRERKAEDLRRIEEALDLLIEHFDCVQIFATRDESGELGGTVRISRGRGNWYARFGQVMLWVEREKALETNDAEGVIDAGDDES
jgi:hypothetical protein